MHEQQAGGVVTRIVAQRKNPERVSIYVDGEFALGVHRDVLLEYPVRRGQTIEAGEIAEMTSADERIRARSRALDLLAYRARTESELRRRLERDGYQAHAVEFAIERVTALGYLDDTSFAAEYASARIRSRGFGRRRIVAELRRKGVAPSVAERAAEEAAGDPDDEVSRARIFAEARLRRLEKEPDALRRRKKLYDALVRRGFDSDVIGRVLDQVLDDIGS